MLSVKILEKKGPDDFFSGYSYQFYHNQKLLPSPDVMQLTLTLKMTTALAVETSVTINNSPIQDYTHPDDHAQPTYVILLCEKLLQFDWLRAVVFQLNLKNLHMQITNLLQVVV